ncbi:MAG: hypothetical protein ACJ760_12245 [Thermoleophilaceae bacterium]
MRARRTATHRHLRERLGRLAVVTVGVDLVATLLVYLFEHGAPHSEIDNIGDAAFWTTTQLLTVSSQLPNPVSTGGRIVDVFLQLWAISVVAALAGAFGAFFHRRGLERDPLEHEKPANEPGWSNAS